MLTFRHSASSEQWGRTGSGDTEKAEKEKTLARFKGVQKRKKDSQIENRGLEWKERRQDWKESDKMRKKDKKGVKIRKDWNTRLQKMNE